MFNSNKTPSNTLGKSVLSKLLQSSAVEWPFVFIEGSYAARLHPECRSNYFKCIMQLRFGDTTCSFA